MGLYKSPDYYDYRFIEKNYEQICGVQIRFIEKSQRKLKVFDAITSFLKQYFSENHVNNYFFLSEPNSEIPNKIRSYKGLNYNKKLSAVDFIEREYTVKHGETIISGLAKINSQTEYLISEQFWASGYQFILSSLKENLFNFSTIDEIIGTVQGLPGILYLDYLDLARKFCIGYDCAIIYYNIIEIQLDEAFSINFLLNKNNYNAFMKHIQKAYFLTDSNLSSI